MGKPFKTKECLLILSIIALLLLPVASQGASYQQVAGLIDLRSTFSDGAYDIETLVKMTKDRGFEVVVINDHDRMVMEYGLPPFRKLIKKRVELPSINKNGATAYLDSIKNVRKKYPDMIIIPGSETAAFYYWTGSYFKKNLTAHDHERRILTIGMEKPEDYENLPILHNGSSTKYMRAAVFGVVLGLVFILVSFFLVKKRGSYRACGVISLILGVVFIINSNPFRNSPLDQYHGDQGMAPYRLLIDYVNSRGGLTFWNYPETKSGIRKMGPIRVDTPPHPEVLEESEGYTGFAALYGDNITVTEPGNVWDRVLRILQGDTKQAGLGRLDGGLSRGRRGRGEAGEFPDCFLCSGKKQKRRYGSAEKWEDVRLARGVSSACQA